MAYDLVPAPEVIIAALHAARRHNCYALAQRVLVGLNTKTTKAQFEEYMVELKDTMQELGLEHPKEMDLI